MTSVARKEPNNNAVVPLSDPARRAELKTLRGLVHLAEGIFTHDGTGDVLREALLSACADFRMLSDAAQDGSSLDELAYERPCYRIKLALALDEYRTQFGRVNPEMESASDPEGRDS